MESSWQRALELLESEQEKFKPCFVTKLEAVQTQEASEAGGTCQIYSIFGGQLKARQGKAEAEAEVPFITMESTLKQMKQSSQDIDLVLICQRKDPVEVPARLVNQ